ncbi:hypothetical protein BBW65_02805 [Helicobacter enhydrae]|uniref:Periplasmic protein n=1 Tax=Helicobacter enhydrae TaxID=222136 RepID=A0A1B1U4T3_9HELI|nr:hypothetical protein [Helicobacter enhydrae]ANV97797.1 hypothetical protein BBW65_02805 [Helicobacter enhydrae]
MKHYKALITAVFLLVITGLFVAIAYFILNDTHPPHLETLEPNNQTTQQTTEKGWIDAIANQKQKSYIYPTNELMMKFNFKSNQEDPLRLIVDDLSEYRFYCLNQVLSNNQVEYAYYRKGKTIQLVVFLNDEIKRKKILEDFKYYQISYSIQGQDKPLPPDQK